MLLDHSCFVSFCFGCSHIAHSVMVMLGVAFHLYIWGNYNEQRGKVVTYILILLCSFSITALGKLNIEQFLALSYPFIHQGSVNKGRLSSFLALVCFCWSFNRRYLSKIYPVLLHANIKVTVNLLYCISMFVFFNYKI